MIFTIRTWSHTPHGINAVCKVVELEDSIWEALQQWAQDNRQALLDTNALALSHADGNHPEVKAALDAVCDSQNLLWARFPMEYRVRGDRADAVRHYFTLVQDNPAMIPAPAPAFATAPAKEAIAV